MFKLLALRVLDGCADHIQKCLKTNVYYYFCTDYRFDEEGKVYRGSRYTKPLHKDFFTPIPEKQYGKPERYPISVNLNAIVGKNGDGKSTIVEIIMRLFNNYVAERQNKGKYKSNQTLLSVNGVCAELYFLKDDIIYKLYEDIDGESDVLKVVDVNQFSNIPNDEPLVIKLERKNTRNVFKSIYTLVSNYSLYAYNIYDFKSEWDPHRRPNTEQEENDACWLYRIFHKNDGYIIPIALHPHRDSGKIDIKNEEDLAKQRLLHLFIKDDESSSAFRDILGKQVVGIVVEPITASKSKYYNHTICDYFASNNEKDTSLDWAINAIRKELKTIEEKLVSGKDKSECYAGIAFLMDNVFNQLNDALECILEGKEYGSENKQVYVKFIQSVTSSFVYPYRAHQPSSINRYVEIVREFHAMIVKYFPELQIERQKRAYSDEETLTYYQETFGKYNLSQLARLYTVFKVAIKHEIDPILLTKSYKFLKNKDKAQLYKIYKTISIFEKYPMYQRLCQPKSSKLGADVCYEYTTNEFDGLFGQLNKDVKSKSPITRKLVITNNYINQQGDITRTRDIAPIPIGKPNARVLPLSCLSDFYGRKDIDIFYSIPPIFEYNILFYDKEQDEYIEMETLSSGEKQLLNTIGAIIYHLRNIDMTVPKVYDTVNLLLEEIELYFHPEYQRLFVNLLLEQIYGANLNKIKNINITFVTHSPFVLSDIPKCNVLFLKDGRPNYSMQENTFGANIHSLIKNGFFLPNIPMGAFAFKKINELFRQLNSADHDHSEESIARIKQEIALVGEPYLREQLYRLLPK